MTTAWQWLDLAFSKAIEISWQASVLVAFILLAQRMLGRRLTPNWRCALWGLLIIRLMMPALPASPVGLFKGTEATPDFALNELPVVRIKIVDQQIAPLPDQSKAVETTQSNAWNYRAFLAAGWLGGVVVIGLHMLILTVRMRRRIAAIQDCTNPELISTLARVCEEIGLKTRPRLVESELVRSPALFGIHRPTILLPADASIRLSPTEIRFVLLHELVHLKRRDLLTGWVTWIFNVIHWFNPVLWYAARQFRMDREIACDAAVLKWTQESDRRCYGQTLVTIAEQLIHQPRLAGMVAMVERHTSLGRRIAAIVKPSAPRRTWSLAAMGLSIFIGLLMLTRAQSQVANPSAMIERTYDVRDLIVDTSEIVQTIPIPPAGKLGVPPQPTSRPGGKSRDQIMAELRRMIQTNVEPETWSELAGGPGTMTEQNGILTIRQTQLNHDSIAALLASTRKDRPQIQVVMRFITGKELEKSFPANGRWVEAGEAKRWSEFLSPADVDGFLKTIQTNQATTILNAPRITLFNRQSGHVTVVTQTAYVQSVTRIETAQGIAIDPKVDTVDSGVMMIVQTTATKDLESVKVDVTARFNRLLEMKPVRVQEKPGDPEAFYQVPYIVTAALQTTNDIPTAKSIVFQMTSKLSPADGKVPPEQEIVYCILTPTVIPAQEAP